MYVFSVLQYIPCYAHGGVARLTGNLKQIYNQITMLCNKYTYIYRTTQGHTITTQPQYTEDTRHQTYQSHIPPSPYWSNLFCARSSVRPAAAARQSIRPAVACRTADLRSSSYIADMENRDTRRHHWARKASALLDLAIDDAKGPAESQPSSSLGEAPHDSLGSNVSNAVSFAAQCLELGINLSTPEMGSMSATGPSLAATIVAGESPGTQVSNDGYDVLTLPLSEGQPMVSDLASSADDVAIDDACADTLVDPEPPALASERAVRPPLLDSLQVVPPAHEVEVGTGNDGVDSPMTELDATDDGSSITGTLSPRRALDYQAFAPPPSSPDAGGEDRGGPGAATLNAMIEEDPVLLAVVGKLPMQCSICGQVGVWSRPEWPPNTDWERPYIIHCMHRSELSVAKALRWCIARIEELVSREGVRWKIGMTGDIEERWNLTYEGTYDELYALHAMRTKEGAWMLEAALIEIFRDVQYDCGSVLVNVENNDEGGTGRPRDDRFWYYVYVVLVHAGSPNVKWGKAANSYGARRSTR